MTILALSWAAWVWIAILVVVLAISVVTVSPASSEKATGEAPP